jgi:hypothetical protein
MRRPGYLALCLVMMLAWVLPSLAQSLAENDAYRAFYGEKDPQKKIDLGEKFLADPAFKESTYRSPILLTIVPIYVQAKNWAKVLDHGEKLPAELPNAAANAKISIYTYAMGAAESTNNPAKMVEFGDKVLAADPTNLQAQVTVATTIPQGMPQDKAANEKAFELANKALAGVAQLFGQPKPANVTDAQWKQARAEYDEQLHSALGMVQVNRKDYAKAAAEYVIVTKSNPKDSVAHFYIGFAYQNQTADASKALVEATKAFSDARVAKAPQPDIDELDAKRQGLQGDLDKKMDAALDEFAISVAIGGPLEKQARTYLESLYTTKHNSLDGLDQFIQSKR